MSSYENHSLPVRVTSSVRVVTSEVPGGVRSFARMTWPMKISWACIVAFYAFIGSSLEDVQVGERVAWYVVFTVLWTVAFAAFAAYLDANDFR